jgi:dihydrofolate reductase
MRTVTYGAACSLDGFIAAADGAIDWLHFSKDVQKFTADYWATVDTVLMGRKTWSVAAAMGGGDGDSANEQAGGKAKGKSRKKGPATYVFSRTLRDISAPGVELVTGDAGEFVRDLKARPGRGICIMGGGELAASLLAAGVVDEVGLNTHPVLLGSGVPLFGQVGRRVPLHLVESRVIDGGCELATYRVKGEE